MSAVAGQIADTEVSEAQVALSKLRRIRRESCKRIRAMLSPVVWKSGYGGLMVFSFKHAGLADAYKIRGTKLDLLNDGLSVLAIDGVCDAAGGGCAVTPFEDLDVMDLLLLERFIARMQPKMRNYKKEI